jgi:hypothetical protein
MSPSVDLRKGTDEPSSIEQQPPQLTDNRIDPELTQTDATHDRFSLRPLEPLEIQQPSQRLSSTGRIRYRNPDRNQLHTKPKQKPKTQSDGSSSNLLNRENVT